MPIRWSRTQSVSNNTHVVHVNIVEPGNEWAVTVMRRTGRYASGQEIPHGANTWTHIGKIKTFWVFSSIVLFLLWQNCDIALCEQVRTLVIQLNKTLSD
jgi:hypothetical protein